MFKMCYKNVQDYNIYLLKNSESFSKESGLTAFY